MQDVTREAYTFSFPTYIRFGCGVINELAAHLKENGVNKPLLVTDPGLAKLTAVKETMQHLAENGIQAELFYDLHKNPVKSDVEQGSKRYHAKKCDSIIGMGGGASMDVARAIALKVNHTRDLFDYVELNGGDKFITESIPYFVTIPTTSGTGSEVGRSAVISDDVTHQKNILFHSSLLARAVFADPELTIDLPAGITAATGMDAFTHNIEAYLSRGFHPLCDGIALEGISLIHTSLIKAVTKPDMLHRANMMAAALMGAVAFQKGLGLVHSMAHALSTHKDLHHGLANAIMLPAGINFNAQHVLHKVERIERYLGLTQSLASYSRALSQAIGLPATLSEQGVSEQDIDVLARFALADGCHHCNEFSVTELDFKHLFKEALH